jgi:hypothetical protein
MLGCERQVAAYRRVAGQIEVRQFVIDLFMQFCKRLEWLMNVRELTGFAKIHLERID